MKTFAQHLFRTSLVTFTIIALVACTSDSKPQSQPRPAWVVQAQPLSEQSAQLYSGTLVARHESPLAFRTAGKVQARLANNGDRVKRGQLLAQLDPADANLSAQASQAAVATAKADLALAQAELERHQQLLDKKYISQALFDARQNQFDAAKARLQQAHSQAAIARNQSTYTKLVASHDGVITFAAAEAGQVVSAGQTVFSLAQSEQIEAQVPIPESQINAWIQGLPVAVRVWADAEKIYSGQVREIAGEADAKTRTYTARVSINDARDLPLGATASVVLQSSASASAFKVPLSALTEKNGSPALWLIDPQSGAVSLHSVKVAQYHEDGAVISSGIDGNSWLIAAGVHKMSEGLAIKPVDAQNRALKL